MENASSAYVMLLQSTRARFQNVVRYLNPRREDRVLEIGCSRGAVTRAVQDIAPETYGIDVDSAAIQGGLARNLQVMSGDSLGFENEWFDKIYSFHTIEHIPDIEKTFKEMARVLKPGGEILLGYPGELIRGMFALVASLAMFRTPFKAREIHLHKFTPGKIKKLAEKTGLQYIESSFSLRYGPEFFTVLRK